MQKKFEVDGACGECNELNRSRRRETSYSVERVVIIFGEDQCIKKGNTKIGRVKGDMLVPYY